MKKFRPILGISLIVQSITFFVLSLVNIERKKNLAKAFAIFGAIGGVAGSWILYEEYKERKNRKLLEEEIYDEFDEFFEDYDEDEIEDDDILCTFEGTEE